MKSEGGRSHDEGACAVRARGEREGEEEGEEEERRRKRIRIFTNHSSRHLREGKSPPSLKSEEVERFIESWDTYSLEDMTESASETSSRASPTSSYLLSSPPSGFLRCTPLRIPPLSLSLVDGG